MEMRFENLGHLPPNGEALAQVFLKAYVKDFGELKGKATAFNFTISNVNFNSKWLQSIHYLVDLISSK